MPYAYSKNGECFRMIGEDWPLINDEIYFAEQPTETELLAAFPGRLAAKQKEKWEAIKAERDRRKAGGVKVGTKWFHTDDASRIQHMALNMMGANIPANLQWKMMDGTFVTMTQALAGQVFQAVAVLDMQAFAKAEEHRVAMNAAENPFEYDFSTGWPKTYAEFVAEQV